MRQETQTPKPLDHTTAWFGFLPPTVFSPQDLARGLGLPCYVFNCSDQMNYRTMADIFKGLTQVASVEIGTMFIVHEWFWAAGVWDSFIEIAGFTHYLDRLGQ